MPRLTRLTPKISLRPTPGERRGWIDGTRMNDGLVIRRTNDHGAWVIIPPDDRPPLARCPCCTQRMIEPGAAETMADAYYPPLPL